MERSREAEKWKGDDMHVWYIGSSKHVLFEAVPTMLCYGIAVQPLQFLEAFSPGQNQHQQKHPYTTLLTVSTPWRYIARR